MAETGIYDLPNEILEQILFKFSTQTLNTTLSNVCTRWKAQSEHILSRRVTNMQFTVPPETLTELKTNSIGEDTDLKALLQFERLNMNPGIRFHVYLPAANYENYGEDLIESCALELRSHLVGLAGEPKRKETLLELDKLFKFIPCHQLLVFINDGELNFFHESVICTLARTRPGYHPYEMESLGAVDDSLSNGVSLLDVYQDRVAVVYKPQDKLVVYQLQAVCHENTKLTLHPLKSIFFHRPVLGITLFKQTVYALSCHWELGAWQVSSESSEARVLNSQRIFPREPPMPPMDILMTRVNNLLFIRLTNSDERRRWLPVPRWLILDMNENSMDPVEVPIHDILLRLIPNRSFMTFGQLIWGVSILGVHVYGNILMFHAMRINLLRRCQLWPGQPRTSSYEDFVLAYQLKRDPKKEDFLDLTKFNQLIDVPSDYTALDILAGFITPLPSSCFPTTNPTFIGLSNSKLRLETLGTVTTFTLSNVEDKSKPG